MKEIEYKWEKVIIWFAKEPLMPTENFWYLWVKIQNLDRTKIMCCECGKFFKRLHPTHIKKHWLTFNEYKKKYWYSQNTSLLADKESLHMSHLIMWKPHALNNQPELLEKAKAWRDKAREEWRTFWENSNERQNKYWTCYDQIKARLISYIESYWQLPTYNSIWEDWIAIYSILKHRYWDINKWFKEYWLPTKQVSPWKRVNYYFKDWDVISVGYNYNNWGKLIKKIKETSDLFNHL